MNLTRILVRVIPALAIAFGALWFYAAHDADSRLRAVRVEIAEQGYARGGRLPTAAEVQLRAEQAAESHGVTLEDLDVSVHENAGPDAAGHMAEPMLSQMQIRVQYIGYEVNGRVRASRWFVRRDEPLHVTFSLRGEATTDRLPGMREPPERIGE